MLDPRSRSKTNNQTISLKSDPKIANGGSRIMPGINRVAEKLIQNLQRKLKGWIHRQGPLDKNC